MTSFKNLSVKLISQYSKFIRENANTISTMMKFVCYGPFLKTTNQDRSSKTTLEYLAMKNEDLLFQ